ncbi:ribonuclease H-like domain-containing protein [Tanacetum coccineum]
MVTRYRVRTNRPTQRLSLHVSSVSPLPKSYHDAFNDSNWQNALCDEYHALIKNKTWKTIHQPTDTNIVHCMWLFRYKYHAYGTLSRYKARLVANGSTQLEGIDVDETFSLVVKPVTIQTVLSLATSRHWPIHQLDVKNAFLYGDLSETVYMHQPSGFRDFVYPDYGIDTAYLLLYVDDIVLTASSKTLLQQIISSLHQEFSMTDLGSLNYFLVISVTRDSSGMFLSQRKYATEILEQAGMVSCNSSRMHVNTKSKLGDDGDLVSDPTLYQSLVGFEVFSWYSGLWVAVFSSSTTDLVAYSDADWAEVEYRGVANAVAETCWLRNHLRELHTPLSSAMLVYYLVVDGQVRVLHIPSRYQYADIFTKGLPSELFEEFRTSLSVQSPPAPTAREC